LVHINATIQLKQCDNEWGWMKRIQQLTWSWNNAIYFIVIWMWMWQNLVF